MYYSDKNKNINNHHNLKYENSVNTKNDKKEKLNCNNKKKYNIISNYNLLFDENEEKMKLKNFFVFPSKIIGNGSFIQTYFGYNKVNSEEIAVKINKEDFSNNTSSNEIIVLNKVKKIVGFPQLISYCKYVKYNIIFETLLGPSLKKIIKFYGKQFEQSTICKIGIEILKRLHSLHDLGMLHNDLKPSNFAQGIFKNNIIESKNTIFLIDFGLCTEINYFDDLLKKKKIKNNKNDKKKYKKNKL